MNNDITVMDSHVHTHTYTCMVQVKSMRLEMIKSGKWVLPAQKMTTLRILLYI